MNGGDQRWQLQRNQKLGKETLFGRFEDRDRRSLRSTIIGRFAETVGDTGRVECGLQVAMDDALSRGSGNAEERGVVLQSCGTFRHVLHIIL
jgi:hypothetical protein